MSIPIFGPTFSGSLQSLADLLKASGSDDFFRKAQKAVYSGTVTGFPRTERFEAITCIPFFSLQQNDEYVLKVFVDFARGEWKYSDREIVVLSEDETPYGAKAIIQQTQETQPPNPKSSDTNCCPVSTQKACLPQPSPTPTPTQPDLVHIYFPRGISQLRSAYQHNVSTPAAASDKAPRTALPLELDSSGSDDYSAPQYSGKQYPLSQEAVLVGIVRELQQQRARVIMLRATDPLDMLFLSRYLRQAYPDGRIITVSSDLLFTRELEDARLHGVMALTTYPLTFGANPSLTHVGPQQQEPRVFPSTHSVGSYNAMKLLLAERVKIEEDGNQGKGCPKDSASHCAHLFQYGWPGLNSAILHPPVYLTVLGHEGYWEVTRLPQTPGPADKAPESPDKTELQDTVAGPRNTLPDVADPLSKNQTASPETFREEPPPGWTLFWIIAVLVSLAYAYFIWSASMLSSSQAVAQLAPSRGDSARHGDFRRIRDSRRYLVATAAYLHFAVLMALLWLYLYQTHISSSWPKFFLIAALVLVVVVGTCDLYRRDGLPLAILLVLAAATTLIFLLLNLKPDYFRHMSYYRSMHLASGVSDLLSVILFLAAGLWGVWYSLSGTSLLDSSRTRLPQRDAIEAAALDKKTKNRLHSIRDIPEEDQSRLLEVIRPDSIDRRAFLFCMTVVLLLLLFTRFRPLRVFEPTTHEYLLAGLGATTFAFLIAGAVRLHSIWIELRRLLIALDGIPLREGFRRLKDFSWSPLWRLGGGNLGDFRRLITLQAEALHSVFNLRIPTVCPLVDDYKTRAAKTQERYEDALNHHLGERSKPEAASGNETHPGTSSAQSVSVSTVHSASAAPAPAPDPLLVEKSAEKGQLAFVRWLSVILSPIKGWLSRVKCQLDKENLLLIEFEGLQQQFATMALYTLAYAADEWDHVSTTAFRSSTSGNRPSIAEREVRAETHAAPETEKKIKMLHAAERFLALLYTSFIMIVLVRIRTLAITIAGMYVLALLALTTYPFQPQVEIKIFLLLLLVFMIALVGTVFAQMHRDTTLINITSIEPGQLKLSFLLRMTAFVALPVFSLVASQYPEIGNLLYSWLEPALNALK